MIGYIIGIICNLIYMNNCGKKEEDVDNQSSNNLDKINEKIIRISSKLEELNSCLEINSGTVTDDKGAVNPRKEIKIGILLGFTGPIESITQDMVSSAELAIKEVSDSKLLLNSLIVTPVRADSTCIDAAAAVEVADRIITSDRVVGIVGADCSGVTIATLQNVAMPNDMVMISPSATSPGLSSIIDNGLFFRTAPSDARQGQLLAQITIDRKIINVAVTYTNNDYGKILSDSYINTYKALGGKVSSNLAHDEGKSNYSKEVRALHASGADVLAVFGYVDQAGSKIIKDCINSGVFKKFILADGMYGDSLFKTVNGNLTGTFGTVPGTDSNGAASFADMATAAGIKADGPFTGESYDAAALMLLAMQSAKSSESNIYKNHIMKVANEPGEKIYPGELANALQILKRGGEIHYVGASNVELIDPGESEGNYREIEIENGQFKTVKYH